MLDHVTQDFAVKIVAALILGGMIGWQREMSQKPAGFRTHILIVLGSTAVMETSSLMGRQTGADPTRIASNIIVGIGFIGAGTILKEGPTVYGLTTAATIWTAGALGLAIGAGYYGPALLLTIATLVVLIGFGRLEVLVRRKSVMRRYEVIARDDEKVVALIQQALGASQTTRRGGLDFRRNGDRLSLSFEVGGLPARHESLFNDLRGLKEVIEIRTA